jgi:hypothetical protein
MIDPLFTFIKQLTFELQKNFHFFLSNTLINANFEQGSMKFFQGNFKRRFYYQIFCLRL